MKLNNELLVIDLETTASVDIDGNQTNNDIIQIGAILLDRNLVTLGKFDRLVKPREEITEFITKLTGITNEMVNTAATFPAVFQDLINFVRAAGINMRTVRFCAWGTYFDIPIMRRLCREYKIPYVFSGTAFDIKTLALLWMSLSNRRTDKLSVEHVSNIMGIKPSGVYHNAQVDAQAEADIAKRIFSDFDQGTFLNGKHMKFYEESR